MGNAFRGTARMSLVAGVLLVVITASPVFSSQGSLVKSGESLHTASRLQTDFAYVINVDVIGPEEESLALNLSLFYWGPNVPVGGDVSETSLEIQGADTPRVINDKITDAVLADAARFGYVLVPRSITIPAFRKGT